MSKAYFDGYRSGKADKRLGRRSDYAWQCVNDVNVYSREYSRGYRRAQEEREETKWTS